MARLKYSYFGFSQRQLVEYGLDLVDAAILRYFVDFKDSGSMAIEIQEGKPYYWVKYDYLIKGNPILSIKSKDALRRRFKKLVDCGVLIHYHKKQGGRYSFYGVGDCYRNLIEDHATQKSEGTDSKVGRDTTQKSEGTDSKVGTKDSSIKDSSINDSSNKTITSGSSISKTDKEFKELSSAYQEVIGQPNGYTVGWLEGLLKEYGFEWSMQAMLEAERRGKRTKSYVEGILQNWKTDGGMKLEVKSDGGNSESNKRTSKESGKSGISAEDAGVISL